MPFAPQALAMPIAPIAPIALPSLQLAAPALPETLLPVAAPFTAPVAAPAALP